jgi:hypothetical protein
MPHPHRRRSLQRFTSRLSWSLLPLALLTASVLDAQTPRPRGNASVTGTVVDRTTGEPLQTVAVRVGGRQTYTDAAGRFRLERVPLGDQPALLSLLGYQSVVEIWTIGADGAEMEVALAPDALILDALVVQVDRLERRRRSVGVSTRLWRREALATSAAPTVEAFLSGRLGLSPVTCDRSSARVHASFARDCYRIRGRAEQPCVIVDDMPAFGGLLALNAFRPQELHRVEVYAGGRMIMLWTEWYMARLARNPQQPLPTTAHFGALCNIAG